MPHNGVAFVELGMSQGGYSVHHHHASPAATSPSPTVAGIAAASSAAALLPPTRGFSSLEMPPINTGASVVAESSTGQPHHHPHHHKPRPPPLFKRPDVRYLVSASAWKRSLSVHLAPLYPSNLWRFVRSERWAIALALLGLALIVALQASGAWDDLPGDAWVVVYLTYFAVVFMIRGAVEAW